MGLSTHRTHTWGAQLPQDPQEPHLGGSAPIGPTFMGLSAHRTHIYEAQYPQHPHLWGSAPIGPTLMGLSTHSTHTYGAQRPQHHREAAALQADVTQCPLGAPRGSTPPPPHSGPPPHTAPPLPPPRGTAALPRHGGRGLKRVGVASKEMGVASISAIISPQGAWSQEMGVA